MSGLDSGIDDVRARKRAALGLSPQRPTAKAGVERPPDPARTSWAPALLPLGLVLIIALTLFLIFGAGTMFGAGNRLAGPNLQQTDWSWAWLVPPDSPLEQPTTFSPEPGAANSTATRGMEPENVYTGHIEGRAETNTGLLIAGGDQPRLRLADNFSRADTIFAVRDAPGQWHTEHVPHQGVYRIEVWPGHVVWSLLDPAWVQASTGGFVIDNSQPEQTGAGYRMQAAATVASHTSWGYAGLAARVLEDEQLILLLVDGRGQFSVQYVRDGVTHIAVPWTAVDALNPAGTGNVLTVEDNGQTMRFFANHLPLFQMRVDDWLPGQVGIAAGARNQGVGEIGFEWFQLYELAIIPAD